MKEKELREFIKTDQTKAELARMQKNIPLAADALNNRIFAICVFDKESDDVENVGSCVLINVDNRIFLVTSAHVFDACMQRQGKLYLYGGGVHKIEGTTFYRANTFKSNGENVPVDAAVLEIAQPVPKILFVRAFSESMMSEPNIEDAHLMVGFPSGLTSRGGKSTIFQLALVPTGYWGARGVDGQVVNAKVGESEIHSISHGFINYGIDVVNGVPNKAKSLVGISGGAVIKMNGVPRDPNIPMKKEVSLTLTSIIVEKRKRTLNEPPLMVCTNVKVHVSMAKEMIKKGEHACSWNVTTISNIASKTEKREMHLIRDDFFE